MAQAFLSHENIRQLLDAATTSSASGEGDAAATVSPVSDHILLTEWC